LISYVTGHHLGVAPQSVAKDQFYCTLFYITLKSNCEAQGVPKNLKKIEDNIINLQKLMNE
jgi:hypothetical protein